MLNLSTFVKTRTGKYLMSILLGIGLATIFRKVCKGKNCLVYSAAPLEEIKDKIYKHDGKCYKYEASNVTCDKSKHIYEFM